MTSQPIITGAITDMKETFKNLIYMARRFKLATSLNILGLILAFAAFYLLMTQIIYQASYNHGLNDYQRLYRLECDYLYPEFGFSDNMCRPFAEALERIPEVESYSLVNSDRNSFIFKKGDVDMTFDVTNGNNTVVSTIAGEPVDGSIQWTDSDQEGYIIPASIAQAYFDTTHAAGDTMKLLYGGETYPVVVRGVYQDFPKNSGFQNCIYMSLGDLEKHQLNFSLKCYVKLKSPPKDLERLNKVAKQAILNEIDEDSVITNETSEHDLPFVKQIIQETRVRLTPLKNSYFESSTYTDGNKGYSGMYYFLILGSLIVIVIGTINFLNCTLVESPMRVRSINTRLVLGAERSKLRQQLITESVITSVIACLIAIALCGLLSLLPPEKILLSGSIVLSNHWPLVLLMLIISIVLGFVAGWYPAKFATSFQPAIALKASFGLTKEGIRLRTILVFIQLLVSMLMIIYIGILFMQSRYIFNSDYGFDKDKVIMAQLPQDMDSINKALLLQELKNIPGVEDFSLSNNLLASTDAQDMMRIDINGVPFRYRKLNTDPNYLNTMGIQIIEGRNFTENDTDVMIINETAREQIGQLGIKISTGFGNQDGDSATVIGVCKNIRYGTMRMSQDQPFAFICDNNPDLSFLNLRLAADVGRTAVLAQADSLIRKHGNMDYQQFVTFDNNLYKAYHYELIYFRQIYTISFICIALTLIGLLCLTMFETEYRRKEIGIRKVAGATTSEVVRMLCSHYVTLILTSFVTAVPVAYLLGKITLDYFADRTTILWWIFPLALLLGGSITLGVVIFQSWRAAHENPVNSIKTE